MYLILLDLVCGTLTSSGSKTWHAFLSQFNFLIIVLYSYSQYQSCHSYPDKHSSTYLTIDLQMISYKKILCLTDPIQLSFNTQTCYTLKIKTPMYFLKVRRSL